jgi:hypothetical protein
VPSLLLAVVSVHSACSNGAADDRDVHPQTRCWTVAALVLALLLFDGPAIAATRPARIISGGGWTCSRTQPEYMIHAGGSVLSVRPGSDKFTIVEAGSNAGNEFADPYITAGYEASLNATLCNGRRFHGARRSRAYALPVRLGRQGNPVASVHDVTSPAFLGNCGFDLWLTRSPALNTYNLMTNGGSSTTEIMIWLSHPGLGMQSSRSRYYPVTIDGRRWQVAVGLAAYGHGRTGSRAGWNVVDFIAPQVRNGNVRSTRLHLSPFLSYAVRHGWLKRSDYLISVNQGFEISRGTAAVAGYVLTGLPLSPGTSRPRHGRRAGGGARRAVRRSDR